ncbi:MAG TPA: protein-L-isoaspartate(D-aspartate) O-methyltransferase [Candidatus Eisenbacteria bacterium]|nr:protein-L-isoaspartate(D-aspartate) O-methyltransferase [Candidatus Eisenbacteria bacterium]
MLGAAILSWTTACAAPKPAGPYEEPRAALVRAIEAEGVRDSATLDALRHVPRHEFVPEGLRALAYDNVPLEIGHGQTISQPTVVAMMTEALRPRRGMKVLEVGTGSGYQAAILAHIGCSVRTIEIVRPLADSARSRLQRLGYQNVVVRHGDGYQGWPDEAPFDAIIVTAAPDSIPRALVEQLAPGGRMVVPVGPEGAVQSLTLLEKDAAGKVSTRDLAPVRFVPMVKGSR